MENHNRRLAALVDRGRRNEGAFETGIADTPDLKDEVYRFRYAAYTASDLIARDADPRLFDWQDDAPNSTIYTLRHGGALVATIRLGLMSATDRETITHHHFASRIDPLLDAGDLVVDGSRLAVHVACGALRRRALMVTLGLTVSFAAETGARWGVMVARRDHASFYTQFGFTDLGADAAHEEALVPLTLMRRMMTRPVTLFPQIRQSPPEFPVTEDDAGEMPRRRSLRG